LEAERPAAAAVLPREEADQAPDEEKPMKVEMLRAMGGLLARCGEEGPKPSPEEVAAAIAEAEVDVARRLAEQDGAGERRAHRLVEAATRGGVDAAAVRKDREAALLAEDELAAMKLAKTQLEAALVELVKARHGEEMARLAAEEAALKASLVEVGHRLKEVAFELTQAAAVILGPDGRVRFWVEVGRMVAPMVGAAWRAAGEPRDFHKEWREMAEKRTVPEGMALVDRPAELARQRERLARPETAALEAGALTEEARSRIRAGQEVRSQEPAAGAKEPQGAVATADEPQGPPGGGETQRAAAPTIWME
jgi:hypothetical protein